MNKETGAQFRATEANLRHPSQRIREGFTLEEAERVVKAKVAEWQGTEFAKYLRPATIFGPKFDGYLQAAVNGNGGRANGAASTSDWAGISAGPVKL